MRLYTDFPDNLKVRRLTCEEQLFFLWYLCLYKRGDITKGTKQEDVAFMLRITVEDASRLLVKMVESNLVMKSGEPKGWRDWQYESDGTATERSRRFRARKKASSNNGNVARNVSFPLQKQSCNGNETPPDTDTDTDTELFSCENSTHTRHEDDVQPDPIPPPITLDEAKGRGVQIGLSEAEAESCWNYYEGMDWITNKAGIRMSRNAAFAKLASWKVNKPRFDAMKRETQARIEASEAIAERSKPANVHTTGNNPYGEAK